MELRTADLKDSCGALRRLDAWEISGVNGALAELANGSELWSSRVKAPTPEAILRRSPSIWTGWFRRISAAVLATDHDSRDVPPRDPATDSEADAVWLVRTAIMPDQRTPNSS